MSAFDGVKVFSATMVADRAELAKLSDSEVRVIRQMYATGDHTQVELGARFGISQVQVGNIVREKSRVFYKQRAPAKPKRNKP